MKRANANLAARHLAPLPDSLTLDGLRESFAAVLYALWEAPPVVMAAIGQASPDLALRIYAKAMRNSDEEAELLAALVTGAEAHQGTNAEAVPIERARATAA